MQSDNFTIFEQVYQDYLESLKKLDLDFRAAELGGVMENGKLKINLLNRGYFIAPEGIFDQTGKKPAHAVTVLLARYVLMCPASPPASRGWLSYKDFPDAAPFAGAFVKNVHQAIAQTFQGQLQALQRACDRLLGQEPDSGPSCELLRVFQALPRINLLLTFNDQDEEFPAQSSLLFADNAHYYLDMECLAILGWHLADLLRLEAGDTRQTLM